MSAPTIPNLLSLRGGSRPRGRGRGGRGGLRDPFQPDSTLPNSASSPSSSPSAQYDAAIRATDTDAAISRLSAVSTGYLTDDFAPAFVSGPSTRRLPIINRGTYCRTTAIDSLVTSFLSSSSGTRQIISLGAGTDTRYFRLRTLGRTEGVLYHEFDFPSVCAAKKSIVARIRGCSVAELGPVEEDADWGWGRRGVSAGGGQGEHDGEHKEKGWTEGYWVHGLDLRVLKEKKGVEDFAGMRADIPTLVISECCLCYLDVPEAEQVTQWFGMRIQHLGIILYEPIGADDAFGQMMVGNLRSRGVVMPTVARYLTLHDQERRLREGGFERAGAISVDGVWMEWVQGEEKRRVDLLEGLDEVEEWTLLAGHYAVVWGWRGVGFEGWEEYRGV